MDDIYTIPDRSFIQHLKDTLSNLNGIDTQNLVYSSLILVVLVIQIFKSGNILSKIKYLLYWTCISFVILVGYSYRYELSQVVERVEGTINPSAPQEVGDGKVTFSAGMDGHFHLDATINNATINFLVDTGASLVTLSQEDARKIGIKPEKLNYAIPTNTANGKSYVALIVIRKITVGSITVVNVRAAVSSSEMSQSLLGMSFLWRLKGYQVSKDILTLIN